MNTLNFNFEIDPYLSIDKKTLKRKDGSTLLAIEGNLELLIDHNSFFSEQYLPLLEFGVSVVKWRNGIEETQESFYYFSMEHDKSEGPILAFIRKENDIWSLFSIWQKFEHKEAISLPILIKAVDEYLMKLDQNLIKNFGVRITDF
nr:hypothetical protein [Cytobacillus firmus]